MSNESPSAEDYCDISLQNQGTQTCTPALLTPDWETLTSEHKERSIFQRVSEYPSRILGSSHCELPIQHFLTGSSYEGSWNPIGFCGYGTYFFSHGAIYEGNFKNGQFHGKGIIMYPVGHKLKCVHKNGKLVRHLFVFSDGLEVHYPNNYCRMPDRRFQVEFNTSMRGAGHEILTNKQPTLQIPEGCYDTIDGFYVPSVKCVYKYNEAALEKNQPTLHRQHTDTLKRTVLVHQGKFIERRYRKSHIDNVGYRPDLYECWVTGRKEEAEQAISDMDLKSKEQVHFENSSLTSAESSSENMDIDIEFEELNSTY